LHIFLETSTCRRPLTAQTCGGFLSIVGYFEHKPIYEFDAKPTADLRNCGLVPRQIRQAEPYVLTIDAGAPFIVGAELRQPFEKTL
jgi:hypothetical protein